MNCTFLLTRISVTIFVTFVGVYLVRCGYRYAMDRICLRAINGLIDAGYSRDEAAAMVERWNAGNYREVES